MPAKIIDGKRYARELRARVAAEVQNLAQHGVRPGLATVMAGESYAAHAYERRLRALAEKLGCRYVCERLPADVEEADAVAMVGKLVADPRVSGILVLRPLPPQVSEAALYRALDPLKDIEAVHPTNAGLLTLDRPRYVPSTPASAFHMLDRYLRDSGRDPYEVYADSNLVLIGRSQNVGKPAMLLALNRNATVVSCDVHSFKAGLLYDHVAQADILIVAAGAPGLVTGEHVKRGVVAIDVGINPVEDTATGEISLVGDLDFPSVAGKAEAISPVPGGVGPITDVWLMHNTVVAAKVAEGVSEVQLFLDGLTPELRADELVSAACG
jgi:methylenetetrahydrofolate dehydrogenase (NADP+)/methenyltetrahydrofolate cyclohydrolase